jgi:hypothetical protein
LRHLLALCCSLILLLPASGAQAARIDVGEAQITFTPPPGYCELDPRQALDARFVEIMGTAMGPEIRILVAFADCVQLSVWRKGLALHIQDYGMLTTVRQDERHSMREPRAAVVRSLTRQLRSIPPDLDLEAAAVNRRSDAADVSLGRLERLGVLHADDKAVYYGLVAEVISGDGRARDAVEVGAMTLIKGKLVSYLLYGEFRGKASVDQMLGLQRSNMDRLIAGN